MDLWLTMPDGSSAPRTPANLRRRLQYDISEAQRELMSEEPNYEEHTHRLQNLRGAFESAQHSLNLPEQREVTPTSSPSSTLPVDPSVDPAVNPVRETSVKQPVDPPVDPAVNPVHFVKSCPVDPSVDPAVNPVREPSVKQPVDPPVDPAVNPVRELFYQDMIQNLRTEFENQRELDHERLEFEIARRLAESQELQNDINQPRQQREDASDFDFAVGICDPAANVLADLSGCFELDQNLRLEKRGIATLYDFFYHIIKDYPCLGQAFENASDGSSMAVSISRFKSILHPLKKPSENNLGVLTLLAVNHFCPDQQHKISMTLAASASLTRLERGRIPTGVQPVLDSCFSSIRFSKLPGITEIVSGRAGARELIDFVLQRIAFVDDAASRLDSAKKAYFALDGSALTDCSKLFSLEQTQFGICTSWKGKPILDDCDRAERFIHMSPVIVRTAWAEHPIDLLTDDFTWFEFRSHLQKLWKYAFDKERTMIKFKVAPKAPLKPQETTRPLRKIQETATRDVSSGQPPAGPLKDITLSCRECTKSFNYPVLQQEFHMKMGWDNTPARCKECKSANSDNVGRLKTLPCYQFANGSCNLDQACKFSHDPALQPKGVHNVAIDSDADDDDEGYEVVRPARVTRFETTRP
jgi:hypothetical protein